MINTITKKRCWDCHRILLRTEFYKGSSAKDGLQGRCKDCVRQHKKSEKGKAIERKYSQRPDIKNKRKEYGRKHYREYVQRPHVRKKLIKKAREWKTIHPWYKAYSSSRSRCRYPNDISYSRYGGRGIKLEMKPNDFKFVYYRDGADKMKQPSISRKDHDGNYTIENSFYEEWSTHKARHNKNKRRRKIKK